MGCIVVLIGFCIHPVAGAVLLAGFVIADAIESSRRP
jgi:hypothetical protein